MYIAFHFPSFHHDRFTTFQFNKFILFAGIDPQHEPVGTDTDAHLIINHERNAAKHGFFLHFRNGFQSGPDPID